MSISFEENRLMTANVYGNANDPTTQTLSDAGWELYDVNTGHLFTSTDTVQWSSSDFTTNPDNGFGAGLYIKKDDQGSITSVCIAYRGTEPSQLQDLGTDGGIAFNNLVQNLPSQFTSAEAFYQRVINEVLPSLNLDPTKV